MVGQHTLEVLKELDYTDEVMHNKVALAPGSIHPLFVLKWVVPALPFYYAVKAIWFSFSSKSRDCWRTE